MTTRIQKLGDGLGLILPPAIAVQSGMSADTAVDVTVENGAVVLRAAASPRYTLDDLVSRITPENVHPETRTGPAVGNEVW
jgi:antitoxin MazE